MIEVVELFVKDAYELDILGPRMLQMCELGDYFAFMQLVSVAYIGLVGFF